MKISCGGCDKTWTGLSMAHCPTCHETFSTVGNFDRHRRYFDRERKRPTLGCYPPRNLGMIQNDRGTWKQADERDVSSLGLLRNSSSGDASLADDTMPKPEPS